MSWSKATPQTNREDFVRVVRELEKPESMVHGTEIAQFEAAKELLIAAFDKGVVSGDSFTGYMSGHSGDAHGVPGGTVYINLSGSPRPVQTEAEAVARADATEEAENAEGSPA